MATYQAKTANPEYQGSIAGIGFSNGKVVINEEMAGHTDRDLDEIIRVMEDLGVEITEVFECLRCGKVFKSKHGLAGHMKAHLKEEPAAEEDEIVEEKKTEKEKKPGKE